MFWEQLKTPAAIVDLGRLERNTSRMAERVHRLGARLRPHVKTHKTVEAARFQVRGHFGGITVSTLAEARHFGGAGFRNVTYAVPVAPSRLSEAVEIGRSLDELNLLVDHEATFAAMEACAREQRVVLPAFLKVDCGYHRAGVDPDGDTGVKLALALDRSPHVAFRGILTHAGHSYHAKTTDEIRAIAEAERSTMVRFAERLAEAGIQVSEISLGSTPTLSLSDSLTGVTEARPGNYVFYDRFQASIGSCSLDDCAFTVLASVLGHYPERGEILIDAGALALSKDEGPTHLDPECGFGAVLSADGGRAFETIRIHSISQEHGKIRGAGASELAALPVGSRIRIVPNHSCLAAALFDRYHVVRGAEVVEEWKPVRGW